VADTGNNRILEFEPPLSNGMNATVVIGQPDFTTAARGTTQSTFAVPIGLAFDASGNLWVADDFNNRVLEFKPPFTTGMNASLVLGEPDFTTANDVPPSQNSLNGPTGVAADSLGDVFVIDTNNIRVLEYKTPLSNGMNASVVIGQADFTHSTIGTSQNQLRIPRLQLGFDGSGNLWVTDDQNNRVLQLKPPFTNGMNASLVIGQSDFTTKSNTGGISGLDSPRGAGIKP
jgi:secreted PhoX family phosphatase